MTHFFPSEWFRRRHGHRSGNLSETSLRLSLLATGAVFLMEVAGALWTNSLALLSDSAHVFMDLLSLALSYGAIRVAERPVSDTRTFGWHRMEVFAALVNGGTLSLVAVVILVFAARRILAPQAILGLETIAIAALGLLANLFVVFKLRPHVREDLNVRSAFLHAFGDAAASLAVIAGGLLVQWTGRPVMDPLAAIAVACIIIANGVQVLRDSVQILLEGAPRHLRREQIVSAIEEVSGRGTTRDFHLWNLCSHISALSVHVVLPEGRMGEQKAILHAVNLRLEKEFNIVHTTIQVESEDWARQRDRT